MKRLRSLIALVIVSSLVCLSISAQAQQQQRRRRPPSPTNRIASATPSLLTGLWQLDAAGSDDPREVAENATGERAFGDEQRIIEKLASRLTSPEKLAIERRGNVINMASSRSPRISFEVDGRERNELATDGHRVRTRAVLYNEQLMVSSGGSGDDDFNVTFDPIDNGRRLRVTRRIYSEELSKEVVVQSIYNKISQVARWSVYGEPESEQTGVSRRRSQPKPVPTVNMPPPPPPATVRNEPEPIPAPPVSERNDAYALIIPDGTQFVAELNNNLSTAQSKEADHFTLTVRSPAQFAGATIEGYVSRIDRAGPFSGRSEMALAFSQIRLRDGRTAQFAGLVESVRTAGDEDVRVNREGPTTEVQEKDNRTKRTVQRSAIGAAVGSIIGAIAGGGKGAAIGAVVGAGVGAGSVYIQGRDDLKLKSGTKLTVRAGGRR